MSGAGTVFTYQMPFGIPGAVNRIGNGAPTDIEAQIMDSTNPVQAYGLFGQIDATSQDFRRLAAGDTAVYGLLVRPYPSQAKTAAGFSGAVPLGTQTVPPTSGGIDVQKMGYMTVLLQPSNAGVYPTIVKNGIVYACIQNPNVVGFTGGIMGTTDGGNAIATNAYFTGPPDANNNVEIAWNIN